MIEGVVNSAREVVVPIHIGRAEAGARTIEAVIDTGYGGFLTLPDQVVDELALALSDFVEVVVADGRVVLVAAHEAVVLWDDQPREVLVHVLLGAPLVGAAMLDEHHVSFDMRPGGNVSIHRLS